MMNKPPSTVCLEARLRRTASTRANTRRAARTRTWKPNWIAALTLQVLVCKGSKESVIRVRQRTELACVDSETARAMDESATSESQKELSSSEAIALTRRALKRTRKSLRDSEVWLNRAKALSTPADDLLRDEWPAPDE